VATDAYSTIPNRAEPAITSGILMLPRRDAGSWPTFREGG
jgi:hypothetical protein